MEAVGGFAELAFVKEDVTQIVERFGELRPVPQGQPAVGRRLFELALPLQRVAKIVMGIGGLRFEAESLTVIVHGLIQLSQGVTSHAEVGPVCAFAGFDSQRPADRRHSLLMAAALMGKHAQQMVGIRTIRNSLEDLPIKLLGNRQIACSMVLQGQCEGVC